MSGTLVTDHSLLGHSSLYTRVLREQKHTKYEEHGSADIQAVENLESQHTRHNY
jgi:hypothetical protein